MRTSKRNARAVVPKAYLLDLVAEDDTLLSKAIKASVRPGGKPQEANPVKNKIRYEAVDVRVSFMPNAADLELEERYMITMDARGQIPEELDANEFGDSILTKPKVKLEAEYSKFMFVRRRDKDVERETKFLQKKQKEEKRRTCCRRRRTKDSGNEASLFECLKLNPGEQPYRNFYLAFDSKKGMFEFLEEGELAPTLSGIKCKEETLRTVVGTRLNPISEKEVPTWRGSALALFISLLIPLLSAAISFGGLGWDPTQVAHGNIKSIALLLMLFGSMYMGVYLFRAFRRFWERKCWRKLICALECEIRTVNKMLADLEGAGAAVSLSLIITKMGENPYGSGESIEILLKDTECERQFQRRIRKKEQDPDPKGRKRLRLLRKVELERNKLEKSAGKLRRKVDIIGLLALKVPVVVKTVEEVQTSSNRGYRRNDGGSKSKIGEDGANGHDAAAICRRCKSISGFVRQIGLDSLRQQLCKCANDDEVEYRKYMERKLAGKSADDQGAGEPLVEDTSLEPSEKPKDPSGDAGAVVDNSVRCTSCGKLLGEG